MLLSDMYSIVCLYYVVCIQHTVKSYVCIYVHMPIDSVFTYYLVLIRWP